MFGRGSGHTAVKRRVLQEKRKTACLPAWCDNRPGEERPSRASETEGRQTLDGDRFLLAPDTSEKRKKAEKRGMMHSPLPKSSSSRKQQQDAAAAAGTRCPHFSLAGKRGRSAPALVDYILVAEFDIDSGR